MANVDYFLKIDGIEGESQDSKHKNEIDLESWSYGGSQTGTFAKGTGGGAGKVQVQDFHFTMKTCKASPKLFLAMCNGQHIKSAILTCRKAGETAQEYLQVTMSDLLVSSLQTGGAAHSDLVPTDQVSLNFTKVVTDYKPQNQDGSLGGSVKVGWDVAQNVKA